MVLVLKAITNLNTQQVKIQQYLQQHSNKAAQIKQLQEQNKVLVQHLDEAQ